MILKSLLSSISFCNFIRIPLIMGMLCVIEFPHFSYMANQGSPNKIFSPTHHYAPDHYSGPENGWFSEIKWGFGCYILAALRIYGSFSGCVMGHFLGGDWGIKHLCGKFALMDWEK